MAYQSPLISIPKKTTTDVDWTGPIRTIIAQSYGEDPKNYTEECSVLQRTRQDAVRGAGSDQTARDLLYKYFGQLELLELRFAEIKVAFPWNDAFTSKLTTQTSLAFEKASIIHLLGSVLSSIASQTSRADSEGLKRAYFHSRAAAGMLTYINENFLHAPSTDLSREVIHLLIGITMAQATEIFTETLVEGKKSPALVCRSANQAASMYAALVDEMKEFQGKGIFDRNWLYILQIKAKLFASLAQYYRSTADSAAGKHGAALVRMRMADTFAQDAQRQASTFTYTFISQSTPSLPHDAHTSLHEITKAHASLCAEAKVQATKDNDLIYHEILPSEAALPQIDKLPPAAPITIQDVYGNPDVSKLIGPDIFIRLVPLAVHESASVYSEEKAKLVRAEVERSELNEGELRAGLEHLGLPSIVSTWRKMSDDDESGQADIEISSALSRLSAEVISSGPVDNLLRDVEAEREKCERDLRELNSLLDSENRDCERMRAKYTPQFTQSPSGPQTAHLRSTIQSNLGSLSAAASSDSHVTQLWQSIQADISILSMGEAALHRMAQEIASGRQSAQPLDPSVSLLDLQDDAPSGQSGLDENEKETLRKAAADATEKLERLGKIRRERDDVLKDLKEKLQSDDVSSLLLLNRRSQNVEPQLFAQELEKFRPYQGRLAAAVQASKSLLQELEMLVMQIERGKGVKERQRTQRDRQKRVREWENKLLRAGETYSEVRAALGKGTSYYDSLMSVIDELRREVRSFVSSRESERNRMVSEIETRQRIASSPPPPPPSSSRGLESQLAGLSLAGGPNRGASLSYASSPASSAQPSRSMSQYASTPGLPAPPSHPSTPSYLPPPPQQQAKPSSPYDFANLNNLSSMYSSPSHSQQTSNTSYPSHQSAHAPAAQDRQTSYGSSRSYASPTSTSSPYPPPPTASPYPPPASQPPRPGPSQGYGQYASQQSYYPPSTTTYQPPPPSSSSSYPAPPQQPSYSTSPPPPSQYPSYAPPTAQQHLQQQYQPPSQQYGAYQPPPPAPPSSGQYGGYQSPNQQGYQYR